MPWIRSMVIGLLVLASLVACVIVWRFAFFIAPFGWTGEPDRLARVLGLQPGAVVADIGAGSGALAVAVAARVGERGLVYATELSVERRADIERRVDSGSIRNVQVITATDTDTRLTEQCCDAVYLRAVFHHIPNRQQFASSIARTLRPHGRVGVIDFAPGALWFHGRDHGVHPDIVVSAFRRPGCAFGSGSMTGAVGCFSSCSRASSQPEFSARKVRV